MLHTNCIVFTDGDHKDLRPLSNLHLRTTIMPIGPYYAEPTAHNLNATMGVLVILVHK